MTKIIASTPASLMLCGEYCVLEKGCSVVLAVNKRMQITLTNHDKLLVISANQDAINYDRIQTGSALLSGNSLVSFILNDFHISASSHMMLLIESHIPVIGLGSSGALISCLVAILLLYTRQISLPLSQNHLQLIYQRSLAIAIAFQNSYSSGSDIAASLLGGVLLHNKNDLCLDRINDIPYNIYLAYCGYKRKTQDIIWLIEKLELELKRRLFDVMHHNSLMLFDALKDKDDLLIKTSMNDAHNILQRLGMSDFLLDNMVYKINTWSEYGAKISGSGLGDCIITFRPNAPYAFNPPRNHHQPINECICECASNGLYITEVNV